MKKQRVVTIILLLLIGCAAAVTAACTPKKLSTPQNLQISNLDLTWDKVDGATGYIVGVNYEEYNVEENFFDLSLVTEPNNYQIEVQAIGDGKKNLNSYWSEKKRYNLKVTEGLNYKSNAGYRVAVVENKDISGVLVIPSTTDKGFTVNAISVQNCDSITGIVIPKTIEQIYIRNCDNLIRIFIPETVTAIVDYSLNSCTNLEKIAVDEGNEVYKSENNCIIRKSDNTLVAGCKNSVIPKYVKTIGRCAFSGCSGLTSIEIPDNIETIKSGAFWDAGIEEIKLPQSLKVIEGTTFRGCVRLKKFEVPKDVIEIGTYTFTGCTLDEITVAEGNTAFKMDSNCLIRLADNTVLCAENVEELIIPDYVSVIDYGLSPAENCKLKKLVIPQSIYRILGSFANCKKIESVVLAHNIDLMMNDVFSNCTIYSVQGKSGDWYALGGAYDGNSCVTVFGCSVKYDGIYPYVYSVERGKIRNPSKKSANPPERKGYTFGGWTTEEGGTTAQYTAAEIENVPQGTTIYAIWLQN